MPAAANLNELYAAFADQSAGRLHRMRRRSVAFRSSKTPLTACKLTAPTLGNIRLSGFSAVKLSTSTGQVAPPDSETTAAGNAEENCGRIEYDASAFPLTRT